MCWPCIRGVLEAAVRPAADPCARALGDPPAVEGVRDTGLPRGPRGDLLAQDRALLGRFRAGERKAWNRYRHTRRALQPRGRRLAGSGGRVAPARFGRARCAGDLRPRVLEKARASYDGLSRSCSTWRPIARNFLLNELGSARSPPPAALESALARGLRQRPGLRPAPSPEVARGEGALDAARPVPVRRAPGASAVFYEARSTAA
jgi:hypothetical protein